MGSLKLSIHPLFFLLGLYYALVGRIFTFIVYTVTAVIHELGHSLVASGMGYRLDKIVLMPFGAVVKGEIKGLKAKDEIKIALAGPVLNLIIAVLFVAVWWIFPESYAYTDIVVTANFSTGIINLLPAFPLDGGRILSALICKVSDQRRANLVCKCLAGALGASLVGLFIYSIFTAINLSILFFALFVIIGAFSNGSESKYVKLYSAMSEKRLRRGVEIKRQAVSSDITIKRLLSLADEQRLNEFVVYREGFKSVVIDQDRLNEIIEVGALYEKLEKYL